MNPAEISHSKGRHYREGRGGFSKNLPVPLSCEREPFKVRTPSRTVMGTLKGSQRMGAGKFAEKSPRFLIY
jgi:hypothetical protein